MRVVITGADGFIGRNLRLRLGEIEGFELSSVVRATSDEQLAAMVAGADAVIHLAGANRPVDPDDFGRDNAGFTRRLTELAAAGAPPIAFASSIRADEETAYGRSKRQAEQYLRAYGERTGAPVRIYRLPNVFGKWARPDYNSAVATFCHNIARGLPIRIDDPAAPLRLVYVDDVVDDLIAWLADPQGASGRGEVAPVFETSVGEAAGLIRGFNEVRTGGPVGDVGAGLARALYATFVSYLPPERFSYPLKLHEDPRGRFVEMLRTGTSGQFSFLTAHPGVTRGGHYHHTKTEKFLVLKGHARFRFRHMLTGEEHALESRGETPEVIDTAPGWTHDITNIGDDEMIVMLWANELFDRARPDTVGATLDLR